MNLLVMSGSVFPFGISRAAPFAILASVLKYLSNQGHWVIDKDTFLRDNAAWTGFTFALGFLVIFRTSQAYSRFWDGCAALYKMRAEWFDACSALCAFCSHSKTNRCTTDGFKFLLIRLFSVLHAVALAEVEDCNSKAPEDIGAIHFELLDPQAIDSESLRAIKNSDCKLELVFQWIQQLIVENIDSGVLAIPPPILSRAFQELANGMLAQHEAVKISNIPFPFPYAQLCEHLLMIQAILCPFVTCTFVESISMSAVFTFVQVFSLMTLNRIALEIENPFGYDANDLDFAESQSEMNKSLALLLTPECCRTPYLVSLEAISVGTENKPRVRLQGYSRICSAAASLLEVWSALESPPNGSSTMPDDNKDKLYDYDTVMPSRPVNASLGLLQSPLQTMPSRSFNGKNFRGKEVAITRSLRSRIGKLKSPRKLTDTLIVTLFRGSRHAPITESIEEVEVEGSTKMDVTHFTSRSMVNFRVPQDKETDRPRHIDSTADGRDDKVAHRERDTLNANRDRSKFKDSNRSADSLYLAPVDRSESRSDTSI